MRRLIPALAVPVILLVACSSKGPIDGPSPQPGSGVRGQVVLAPSCPVEIVGSPCPDRAWQGKVQAFTPTGILVREASTNAGGAFEMPLDPGTYDLIPYTLEGPPTAKMQRIKVTPHAFLTVTLHVDTGIR
jgi:hypothetical protein